MTKYLHFACLVAFFVSISLATTWAQSVGTGSACSRSCKYPKKADGSPLELLPESDNILGAWNGRARYYIAMGVSNGPEGATEDDFAKADVGSFVEALCKQGFQPLPNSAHMSKLVGKDASVQNLDEEITEHLPQIAISKRPLLLLYYSGHGQVDDNFHNLILWAGNAKTLDPKYSFSLREEVRRIRTVYSGDLVIVLDACYSGQAFRDLNNVYFDDRTAVLASSSDDQQSEALKMPGEGDQLRSAFTYAVTQVLRGSEPCDPGIVNASLVCKSTSDGILGINQLAIAVRLALAKLPLQHKVDPVVHGFAKNPVGMIGYFCETVKDLDTNNRSMEAGAEEVLNAVNASARSASDKEDLGIADQANRLLAVVATHVSNGKVLAVTVESFVDPLIKKSSGHDSGIPQLRIVRLTPGFQQLDTVIDFSPSASQTLLKSFAAQDSLIKQDGATVVSAGDFKAGRKPSVGTGTILVKDIGVLAMVLSEDAKRAAGVAAAGPN